MSSSDVSHPLEAVTGPSVVSCDAKRFTAHLESGEKLLWTGRPQQGLMLRSQDWALIPFSAVWAAGALIGGWRHIFTPLTSPEGFTDVTRPQFLLWLAFVIAGVYLLAGRVLTYDAGWHTPDALDRAGRVLTDTLVRANLWYALTDRRALVLYRLGSPQLRSYSYRDMPDASLSQESYDGRATVNLGLESWFHRQPIPGFEALARPKFERIPEAATVLGLVKRHIGLHNPFAPKE